MDIEKENETTDEHGSTQHSAILTSLCLFVTSSGRGRFQDNI
jgi:hypothetical protein